MYYLQSYKRQMCTCSLGTITRQQNVELGPSFAFCAYQTVVTNTEKETWYHGNFIGNSFFSHLGAFIFLTALVKLTSAPQ